MKLAQDRNSQGTYRLAAAKELKAGKAQEQALEAIARDRSVEKQYRIEAANALASEALSKELLAHIG